MSLYHTFSDNLVHYYSELNPIYHTFHDSLGHMYLETMPVYQTFGENLEHFCFGFPLIVGYSKKKFAKNLEMTDEQLYNHCIHSGVSLVRLHIAS